tara:strand:- start:92 stop:319 length:228 start_codon:yes stop_codon:yes gene_type:complete
MKKLYLFLYLIFLTNCSFNENSKFWTEDVIVKKEYEILLNKILDKSNDLMSLTFNEYKIYIDEYNKKSKYPDINK